MDKKKALLVVILASILAFMAVMFIFQTNKKDDVTQEQTQEIIEQEIEPTEQLPTEEEETVVEELEKAEKNITKVAPKAPAQKSPEPIIKPIQVEEAKVVEGGVEETEIDAGIYKDANSVVITREFKTQTRAKYSFEGYGVQKAPVK